MLRNRSYKIRQCSDQRQNFEKELLDVHYFSLIFALPYKNLTTQAVIFYNFIKFKVTMHIVYIKVKKENMRKTVLDMKNGEKHKA